MFWRFGGYANISTIDTILDKPEFTLEELLDESDLIQELKQHNSKLIEYLRGDSILEKLLEYVVAPKLEAVATPSDNDDIDARRKSRLLDFSRPRASSRATDTTDADDDDEQEKRRNRYALVACEVLSSDTWSIYEALTEKRDLIRKFWSFLERPAPLDPLQASYFTKVNESLFEKKTDDMMELFRTVPNVVQEMLKHVECPMIMDLLLKIIALDRNDGGQGIVEWLYARDIVPTLLSCLDPKHSWVVQTAAGDFIKAIITISANASQNEQQCIGPNELTRQLVSQPCAEQLIRYMLGGGNPLTVGVGIVIEVIRKNNSDYDPDVGSEANTVPSSRDPIYLGTLLRLFAQNVPRFMSLVMEGPARKDDIDMGSTFGEKLEPLGFDRFKTCELMAELLHCSNMGLLNEVGSEQLIAARDAERQRLREDGKLFPQSDDDRSTDNLTMRMSHGSPDEGRRLEITNADDDGFEEVEHSKEMSEDTSDEFVKAEDDIAVATPPASFLEKDEDDFVDEPLSSPRLSVTADKINEQRFDDADLVVAPLSPTKPKPAEVVTVDDVSHTLPEGTDSQSESRDAQIAVKVSDEQSGPTAAVGSTDTSVANEAAGDAQDGKLKPNDRQGESHRDLSPHPEDTPAPLFSSAATSQERPHSETAEATVEEVKLSEEPVPTTQPEDGHGSNSPSPQLLQPQPEGLAAIEPVVGDYLKMQFVEHRVVPAILSFFFSYPWNNFLHNVVYDIVQQVFNGPMDRGYNPTLAVSLFEAADVTVAIIKGQQASDESQAKTRTRMGYMGHLTLIAEEVVKFTERHPPELLSEMVLDKVMSQEWISYVEGALAETRERDNAILGGVRPEVALGHRVSIGGGGSGLGGVGLSGLGGMSTGASNALAEAGLNGGIELNEGEGTGLGPFAISAGTLMSGFGSSSDEEDDDGEADEEDINLEFRAYAEQSNDGDDSASAPSIPPPPPPPPPLNIPPSRARLQLAARLAMHQKNNQTSDLASDSLAHMEEEGNDEPATDPFGDGYDDIDAGLNDDVRQDGGRGSWWRSMVGTQRSQNDGGDSDEAENDDEFGDFALAEEDKSGGNLANKDELVLRPLAASPSKDGSRTGGGLSSLWPFGSRSGEKDNSAGEGNDSSAFSSGPRGDSAVEVTEAMSRTSIEEPDEEEQMTSHKAT